MDCESYIFNQNILKLRKLGSQSVLNGEYYYHSITDNNLIKLDLILNFGILSKELQFEKGLAIPYASEQYGGNEKYVFLTEFNDCSCFALSSEVLKNLMKKVSLVVKKEFLRKEKEVKGCYYPIYSDEVLIKDMVDRKNIIGIMVPSALLDKQIRELTCFGRSESCYTKENFSNYFRLLNDYFNVNVDKTEIKEKFASIMSFLNMCKARSNLIDDISELSCHRISGMSFLSYLSLIMQECWNKKLGLNYDVAVRDIVIYIKNKNPDLIIFNELGIEYDTLDVSKKAKNKEFTK